MRIASHFFPVICCVQLWIHRVSLRLSHHTIIFYVFDGCFFFQGLTDHSCSPLSNGEHVINSPEPTHGKHLSEIVLVIAQCYLLLKRGPSLLLVCRQTKGLKLSLAPSVESCQSSPELCSPSQSLFLSGYCLLSINDCIRTRCGGQLPLCFIWVITSATLCMLGLKWTQTYWFAVDIYVKKKNKSLWGPLVA